MTLRDGMCLYGGTKDNGVYLLIIGPAYGKDGKWYCVRADHCWHVVDSFGFNTMSIIKQSDIDNDPQTRYGGWREITRDEFKVQVERILNDMKSTFKSHMRGSKTEGPF